MTKATILIGVSGAGKSTYAAHLRDIAPHPAHIEVVSADDYMTAPDGTYTFDRSKLQDAHGECLKSYINALRHGIPRIIVDNTNTTLTQIAPYVAIAQAYHYDVDIVHLPVDIYTAEQRNVHGVRAVTITRQANLIASMLMDWPRYWPGVRVVRHATQSQKKYLTRRKHPFITNTTQS